MAEGFESWAIVELMGRTVIAGKLSDQVIGGDSFLRVDIPRKDGTTYTRLFGKAAIYCINICEEETARTYAARTYEPLQPYTALPAPSPATETAEQLAARVDVPISHGAPSGRDPWDEQDDDQAFDEFADGHDANPLD
jgi:hypothetical protein